MARPRSTLFIGLISGTSVDGIDAVLADFSGQRPRVLAALTHPYPETLRDELRAIGHLEHRLDAREFARLDARVGDSFADAALAVLQRAGVAGDALAGIGSHGQTVAHNPDDEPPSTWQLGDAHRIAHRTGVAVVADCRRADMAAGGQGAPLAPLLHRALWQSSEENRAVVNLGGIANLTVLQTDGGFQGFDTGPANCLMDAWYQRHQQGSFDPGGRWALGGNVDQGLLDTLLADPYFEQTPPKSTGTDYFNLAWLEQHLAPFRLHPADVQATLAELSAETVFRALPRPHPGHVIATGGGVHNECLMAALRRRLGPGVLVTARDFDVDPDFVEALLFAWLARERLAGRRIDTAPVTGAEREVFLGVVFEP